MPNTFDAIRFMTDHFSDSDSLREALRRHEIDPPTFEAIRKWRQRKTYPIEWLVSMLAVLEVDNGQPVSITPYMEKSQCAKCPSKAKPMPIGGRVGIFD